MITESEAWAVAGILATNFAVAAYFNTVSELPEVAAAMDGPVAVWSSTILSILGVEAAVIVLSLGLAFFVQSRKKDFV
jgi:hypothetical protein